MQLRKILTRYDQRLKAARSISDAVRYNPFYYGPARSAIARFAESDFEGRAALADRLFRAVARQARQTGYGRGRREDPSGWPVLQKAEIRDRPEKFFRRTLIRVPAATGGTTGTPLRLARSLRGVAAEQAFIDSLIQNDGLSFRTAKVAVMRAFTIKDRADEEPPFGFRTQGGRCLMLSSYHLSGRTAPWYAAELERFAPDVLFVYPSMLARLLNSLADASSAPRVPISLCSSEMMPDGLRADAARILSTRIVDYYGLAERVCFAWSKDGEHFYFSPAYGRTELLPSSVDPKVPGVAAARIVATGFWNDAMPLVRYETGDLAIVPADASQRDIREIELGLRPFLGILGRQDDAIRLPDSTVVYGLNQIAKVAENASQVQFVQLEPLKVALFVVPKPGYGAADSEALLRGARARFPANVEVSLLLVDKLRQTASGKTPFVIPLRSES
jgi:phenylacetate-CoA ligase